jgi:hypothetical protein
VRCDWLGIGVLLTAWLQSCSPAANSVASGPAGAAANVAIGATVGLVRYGGDCGRYSDAGGADCFRGGYPSGDKGEVRIESPPPGRLDGGVGDRSPSVGSGDAVAVEDPPPDAALRCRFPPAGSRSLEDWSQARAGDIYAVVLEYRQGWVAADTRTSLLGSKVPELELDNLDDHPEFSEHRGRLGATLLLRARQVRETRDRSMSLVTWTARIVGVCRTQ